MQKMSDSYPLIFKLYNVIALKLAPESQRLAAIGIRILNVIASALCLRDVFPVVTSLNRLKNGFFIIAFIGIHFKPLL